MENEKNGYHPPSQKTSDVSPRMNAVDGPSEARRVKEGASADFAEEMKETTVVRPWRLHKTLRNFALVFLVLSFIGFLDAAYLMIQHYRGLPPDCSLIKGCEVVTSSKYSEFAGIPIALPGAIFYLSIFVLSFLYFDLDKLKPLTYASWLVIPGFGITLFLVYLQLFVLGAICLYCMVSAGITSTLFVVGLSIIRQSK